MILTNLLLSLTLASSSPASPMEFASAELTRELQKQGLTPANHPVEIEMTAEGAPESYAIRFEGRRAIIQAPDANGAMYGVLELTERLHLKGEKAWGGKPISDKPFLHDRSMNVFLTLPWQFDQGEDDSTLEALQDPKRWWFLNDDYWHTLFDQMARARLNWLDLHGTFDFGNNKFPNLYAYFVQSSQFPKVGLPPPVKAKCLEQLNHVIELAHQRGIKVNVMAYESKFGIPQNPKPPYEETREALYAYTREVVEAMVRQAPKLDAIGFRIGESGKDAKFFTCYLEAVANSPREIPIITRSWWTRKAVIAPLARNSSDLSVEIKFNGEQWGPPYPVAGGNTASWASYWYEDYLSYSGEEGKRIWPGQPGPPEETWPSEPYKIIWQLRARGTHRLLPFYNPNWIRRTVQTMNIGTTAGFSFEPLDTYTPKDPAFYRARESDKYCDWMHQRDVLYNTMWGRLSYDPQTPDAVFERMLDDAFGQAGPAVIKAWTAASLILPAILTSWCQGPDHIMHCPEMEWCGGSAHFRIVEPFDTHVFKSIGNTVAEESLGCSDGRISTVQVAAELMRYAETARSVKDIRPASIKKGEEKRFKEIKVTCEMLAAVADYYAGRFLESYYETRSEAFPDQQAKLLPKANAAMKLAEKAWVFLSESEDSQYFKPFNENFRMRDHHFHWRKELPEVRAEAARVNALAGGVVGKLNDIPKLDAVLLPKLDLHLTANEVSLSLPAQGVSAAWALVKPLPSTTYFHKFPMQREGGRWVYRFARENWGHNVAAEVQLGNVKRRLPFWEDETPYLTVPALAKPTPYLYCNEEALRFLKPEVIVPEKYSLMLLGSRAYQLRSSFKLKDREKLLEPVSRGMALVVLDQDAKENSLPDWLPAPVKIEQGSFTAFDPGGQLGLEKVEAPGIMDYRFLASDGWEVFGNGGLARCRHGKGQIWIVSARLESMVHLPAAGRDLVKLITLNGTDKPVVLLDAGDLRYNQRSSLVADLMTSVNVPFKTLGEVVADEQGMDSITPVASGQR